jgi:hypothetical protein
MIGRNMNQLVGAALLIIGLMFLSGWLVLPWTMETIPPCPNPKAQHNIYLSNGVVTARSSHDEAWAYAKDNPNVVKITRLDVVSDPTSPTGRKVIEVVEWENPNPPPPLTPGNQSSTLQPQQPPSTQQQPIQQTPSSILSGLTLSQLVGAALFAIGVGLIVFSRR